MTTIGHIAWKELRTYFSGWMAYVICAGWLLLSGSTYVNLLQGALQPGGKFFLPFLLQYLIIVFMFVTPLLTMRLFAEERASGSLEMLFTSPLAEWQVALGKWLGALGFCLLLLVLTAHYTAFTLHYGDVDQGPIWGSYLALVCLTAAFCAFGLLCSSLTESQVVAGFLTFGGLLLSWAFAQVSGPLAFLSEFSVLTHFVNMVGGAIDTKDLFFFLSLTGFFLFATVRVLESRQWR